MLLVISSEIALVWLSLDLTDRLVLSNKWPEQITWTNVNEDLHRNAVTKLQLVNLTALYLVRSIILISNSEITSHDWYAQDATLSVKKYIQMTLLKI